MKSSLIAPCGMNCALCLGYLREKNRCNGCNSNENIINYCKVCKIRNCEKLKKYCFNCKIYSCYRLKQLDKRYKTRYNMSMIDNLNYIKEKGIRNFIKKEKEKWKCPTCNSYICVHRGFCLNCHKKNIS